MSIAVLSRVMGNFHPESEVAERLVLVVLADAAHDDGITWISQEEIAGKALLSVRHVGRCIKALDERMEIEARKAQRGRRRINVYRVAVAPADPDYDRLPFAVNQEFSNLARTRDGSLTGPPYGSTKGPTPENDQPCPVVDDEDVRSSLTTTRQDVRSSGPPKVWLDENNHNLPLDALLEALAIDPKSPRVAQVVVALNGRKGKPEGGIRQLFWVECCRYAEQAGRLEDLASLAEEPETFDRLLAARIPQKVRKLKARDPWRTGIAPAVLRDLWLDVELGADDGRGLTPDEIRRIGRTL